MKWVICLLNNQEYILAEDPFSAHPGLTPGRNAFSGSGDVTARVVYWHPDPAKAPLPSLGDLGGGSDHVGFYTHLGIPAAGLSMSGSSLYHSGYDDFAYFSRFCDPDFAYGPTIARVDGLAALRLANADLLPYSVSRYPADLLRHAEALEKRAAELGLEVALPQLRAAIARLDTATAAFGEARDRALAADRLAPREARQLNQDLIALERAFVHPDGLQDRPWSRSLYAAPDPFSGYAAWMLPGLRYEIETGRPEGVQTWEPVYARAVDDLAGRLRALAARIP